MWISFGNFGQIGKTKRPLEGLWQKKIHAKIEIFLSISNWYMFYSDVIKNRKIKLNTQINYLLIFFVLSSLSFQKSKTEYN